MAKKNQVDYEFEDMSSFSSHSEYKKTKKAKKHRHRGLKAFITVICVLLVVIGGGLLYVSNYLLGDLTTNQITKDKDALGIMSGVTTDSKVTNIALFGVDARGDVFEGRSDVVIVLSIDQIHDSVKLTSILRDSRVYMGENYPNTSSCWDKITHAYYFGGPELAIKVINQNFQLDITDYVTVNFSKMASIVDAFNGVDMEITDSEMEQININLRNLAKEEGSSTTINDGDYVSSSGMVHLTGNAAVAYARIRYIDSDNKRAERQQLVLEALMTKLKDISVTEYPGLIKKLTALCETSLDFSEMMAMVPFALTNFNMERLVVPGDEESPNSGYYENGGWMWDYDLENAANHIHNFIYGDSSTSSSTSDDTGTTE